MAIVIVFEITERSIVRFTRKGFSIVSTVNLICDNNCICQRNVARLRVYNKRLAEH